MRSLVICWYQWISQSATVPGWKWCGFQMLLALGVHLPLCKSGVHPWEAMPRLANLFLFALHTSATDLSAAWHICLDSLVCCALVRKVPGGFFWWNLSWAHYTLSCGQSSSGSPPAYCKHWLPLCWVDFWCPPKPLAPIRGEDLSMSSMELP